MPAVDIESKGSSSTLPPTTSARAAADVARSRLLEREEHEMTIAVVQDFAGATLDEYDRVIDKMGITSGGKHSDPGCLFHWVTATDTGLRVVPNPPHNTVHDVHAYFH
jgi:hypothetical protein